MSEEQQGSKELQELRQQLVDAINKLQNRSRASFMQIVLSIEPKTEGELVTVDMIPTYISPAIVASIIAIVLAVVEAEQLPQDA